MEGTDKYKKLNQMQQKKQEWINVFKNNFFNKTDTHPYSKKKQRYWTNKKLEMEIGM